MRGSHGAICPPPPPSVLMLVAGLVGAKNLSTSTCCSTLCPHRQPTRGTHIPHSADAGAGAPEAGRLTRNLQQAVGRGTPSLHSTGFSPGQQGDSAA